MQKVKSRFTLKTAREMKRYTQEEAAKLNGVSVDTLGNYEHGKSYPDIPVLRKIEEIYGVPYEQLIFLPLDYDKTVNIIEGREGSVRKLGKKKELGRAEHGRIR